MVSAQLLSTTKARRVPLRSQVDDGPIPAVVQHTDEASEAAAVVTQIGKLIAAGTSPREIAILVRINALTEQFESALADAGIPYSVRGGRRFFDRPEVRRGVSLLRGAARGASTIGQVPEDAGSLVRTILSSAGWTAQPPTDTGAVRESWSRYRRS